MKKFINETHIEGYVFSHSLQVKVTGPNSKTPGTTFISGDLNIATDEQAMNVVKVHWTYVTEKYSKSGNDNATFGVLKEIIDSGKTYETVGTNAPKVRVDGNVWVNDFYTREGQLASPKQIEGSFCHLQTPQGAKDGATFKTDMLITGIELHDLEDGNEYLTLKGHVFNFRGAVAPVDYTVRMPEGINYFQNQEMPMLTKVWGDITSTTIENKQEVESAFGASTINITTRTLRSWDVNGTSPEPMDYNDDSESLTPAEFKAAMADRVTYLANEKKRTEDYRASKSGSAGFPSSASNAVASPTAMADYKF